MNGVDRYRVRQDRHQGDRHQDHQDRYLVDRHQDHQDRRNRHQDDQHQDRQDDLARHRGDQPLDHQDDRHLVHQDRAYQDQMDALVHPCLLDRDQERLQEYDPCVHQHPDQPDDHPLVDDQLLELRQDDPEEVESDDRYLEVAELGDQRDPCAVAAADEEQMVLEPKLPQALHRQQVLEEIVEQLRFAAKVLVQQQVLPLQQGAQK